VTTATQRRFIPRYYDQEGDDLELRVEGLPADAIQNGRELRFPPIEDTGLVHNYTVTVTVVETESQLSSDQLSFKVYVVWDVDIPDTREIEYNIGIESI